jgi:pyruvate dehydrogenase E2 component (dihydrolipoamide acetyltransferase)
MGMLGVEEFTAIINQPESGILAVGRIADKVVAVDGKTAIRPMMKMTMSCDHRVVDGALGAQFLARVKELLENPGQLES